MQTCLVTGAAGFIGSHVCERLLADGHRVVGLDSLSECYDVRLKRLNLRTAARNPRFSFVVGDLRTIALGSLLRGTDLVFHFAATVKPQSSAAGKFQLTERLVESMRAYPISAFVYASSCSGYGAAAPMGEDAPPRPAFAEGADELVAERIALRRASECGIRTMVARYFTVYGPRQRPDMLIARLIDAALDERSAEMPAIDRTHDLIYVDDAVDATMAIAQRGTSGHAYRVGSGRAVPLSEIIGHVEHATRRQITTTATPALDDDVPDAGASFQRLRSQVNGKPKLGLAAGIALQVDAQITRRNELAMWSRRSRTLESRRSRATAFFASPAETAGTYNAASSRGIIETQ